MTSHIKVRASDKRIGVAFNETDFFSVRYYNKISEGLFEVTLRHKELPESLKGTYTVGKLYKTFGK